MSKGLCAIILSAGYSSRMGSFKPLLTLGGQTLVERSISLFQKAGVEDVLVVAGHRADELAPEVFRCGARVIVNDRFDQGMYSSVQAGVGGLGAGAEAFFIQPVDLPLVRDWTVNRVLEFRKDNPESIIYPVFQNRRGHPPLIPTDLVDEIMSFPGDGGLKALLRKHDHRALEVETADRNILFDADTASDFDNIKKRRDRYDIPAVEECQAILREIFQVEERVYRHSRAVADLAGFLGEEFNAAGGNLDLELIRAAAWLHDLAKGQPRHDLTGGRILREMGLARVADIVEVHVSLASEASASISESEIVYLADKLMKSDHRVSLEQRFQPWLKRFAGDPEVRGNIEARLVNAISIKELYEKMARRSVEDIWDGRPV